MIELLAEHLSKKYPHIGEIWHSKNIAKLGYISIRHKQKYYHFGDYHFGDYHFGDYHFGDYHFGDYHFGDYHFGDYQQIVRKENDNALRFHMDWNDPASVTRLCEFIETLC